MNSCRALQIIDGARMNSSEIEEILRNPEKNLKNILEDFEKDKDKPDFGGKYHQNCTCKLCQTKYSKVGRDYKLCSSCLKIWEKIQNEDISLGEYEQDINLRVRLTREGLDERRDYF